MVRSSSVRIAVVASDEWIGRLLEDFVDSCGWRSIPVGLPGLAWDLARLAHCSLVLCDLDLLPSHLAAVRGVGRPLVYFSSSSPLRELSVPRDAAATFELPPDWAELGVLLRSLL